MSKKVVKKEELAHSPIGASSMERWSTCPGSIRLSKGIKGRESAYALEGTKAHELAATILECELAGQPWHDPDADPEMLEAVMVYVKEVMSDAKGNKVLIEQRVDLSSLHPGLFGTCDNITFVADKKLLRVRDYKHGQGISVEAKGNLQMRFYGLGALLSTKFPCEKVELQIVQPRGSHPEGPIRSEIISSFELLEFADELKTAAERTEDPNAPLHAGEHCRFCPAAGICPEIKNKAQAIAKGEFGVVREGVAAAEIDTRELARTLEWIPILKAYLENVHEFAYNLAQRGVKIPGWKLVAKRPTRKWIDPAKTEKFLADNYHATTVRELYESPGLKSVAQVEKILHEHQWEKIVPFISNVSSGEVLVQDSDKRPEIQILDAKSEFTALELID